MTPRAFLLALILFAFFAHLAQADDPISLDEYRAVVAQTFDLVEQATRTIGDQRASLLNQAADTLARAHEIQLDAAARVAVNNDDLIAELERVAQTTSATLDVTKARDHVGALRDALATLPTAANETERAKLRGILDNSPFVQNNSNSFSDRVSKIILDWLNSLLRSAGRGTWQARDLITLGAVFIVLIVIVFFIVNLRRQSAAEEALPQTDETGEAVTSRQALQNAQQFAGAGDYRSAMRQLYLATLLLLDEKGKLRYDHSLTNREYVRAVQNDPPTARALRPIVETFDRIWYGFEPVSAQEFETYKDQVAAIQKL